MSSFSFFCIILFFLTQFYKSSSLASSSKEGFDRPPECPGEHSHRELLACDLTIPQHANVVCKSWNKAEIRTNKDKNTDSPNALKRLIILCQRGSPFFLDSSKLNWEHQTYKVTYGNQLYFQEISSGIYQRHGFNLRITLPEVSKTTEKEVFQFYSQNERGTPKNLTTFTLLIHQTEDNCTRKHICGGRDPAQNCKERVISSSCDDDSNVNQTSCTLKTVHESGIIVCGTKDDKEKHFVEFFTALDGFKYRNDYGDPLAIDKLVKVKLDKKNENRLFYPDQWITIKYNTLSYPFDNQIYWEYKLKDGHLGSFVYEEERKNLPDGMVQLKMKKDMAQILYFVPWSPYPVGSAIDVLVTKRSAPQMLPKNVTNVKILGTLGKELLLTCEVKGNPLPQIKWSLGDNEVNGESLRYNILKSSYEEKTVSILRFGNFAQEDVGKYTCTAVDAEGSFLLHQSITWEVEVNSGIGYEASVGIVLILIAIVLVGAICYQIWFPPEMDKV